MGPATLAPPDGQPWRKRALGRRIARSGYGTPGPALEALLSTADVGAFRLLHPLAEGGIAQVWTGEHRDTRMPVSIKVITGERARDPYFRASFTNEVRAVAALDHPGIVQVLDHGQIGPEGAGGLEPGSPYLVMELASAGTLRATERRALAWPEIRTILLTLLGALGHAHARGVIHRDLKPGNVLLCGTRDARPGLKLTDFGLARLLEDHDRPGSVEAVRGTLHYMAPEQCQGLWRDQGPWTDLYALGCIAYQLATGRPPFRGFTGDELMTAHVQEPPPALPPRRGLPRGYSDWVARLLAKDRFARLQRAADAAWTLSRLPEPEDVGPTRWIFPDLAAAHGLSDDLDTDPVPRTPLPGDLDPVGEPTVRVSPVGGANLATPIRRRPAEDDVPPIPTSWRQAQVPEPDLRLLGAAQSMIGLRTLGLVGRHAERDRIWEALRQVVRQGRPAAIVLRGPQGSGSSRLSDWIGGRAHEVGAANVFVLSHRPGEAALVALRRALAREIGTAGLDDDGVADRVARFVARYDLPEIEPTLTALLSRRDPQRPTTIDQVHGAIADVLCRLAEQRAVVLRVEDLHRCPANAALALQLLARSAPILSIITRRLDSEERRPHPLIRHVEAHPGTQIITPGPLTLADMRSLLRAQLGLSAPLSLRIEEIVQGNPLFAVQLVLGWAQRGLLVPTDQGFTLPAETPVELPDDLHAAWAQRIDAALDRQADAVRAAIERAAVLGERFDPAVWHTACASPDPARDGFDTLADRPARERGLRALLDADLLVTEGSKLCFAHPMLRESLVRAAREAGRLQAHHQACARAVEASLSTGGRRGRAWRSKRQLALHLHAAGRSEEAIEPLLRAAQGASDEGEARASLALAALATDLLTDATDPRTARAMRLRLQGHAACGEFPEADRWDGRLFKVALELADPTVRGDLLLDLAHYAVKRGRIGPTRSRLAAARAALPRLEAEKRALSLALAEGHLARLRGEPDRATRWLEDAITLARDQGERTVQGATVRALGAIHWHEGRWQAAEEAYTTALTLLHDGPLAERAAVHNNLGECARRAGDLDRAERCYHRAAELFERAGAAAFPYPLLNLGIVRVHTGRHRAALDPLARALEELERQGDTNLEAVARLVLLPCCAALGDWRGWTRQLDRLDRLGLPDLVESELGHAVHAAAETALQAGRPQEAHRGFTLAAALHQQAGAHALAAASLDRARELG